MNDMTSTQYRQKREVKTHLRKMLASPKPKRRALAYYAWSYLQD